jgi:hypothetical protein
MKRYYFNFRKGDEISVDRRGMWLPDVRWAEKEAIQLWGTVLAVAIISGAPRKTANTKSPMTMAIPSQRFPLAPAAPYNERTGFGAVLC